MSHKLQFCVLAFCAVIATAFGGVNKSFGNCETNGANFAYAPEWLYGRHMSILSSNDYERADFWPVTDVKPPCDTNHYANPIGWAKHDYQVPREVIDWHCITNTSGEEEWIPVTNTVYDTKFWIERNYEIKAKPIQPIAIPRYSVADLFFWVKLKGKEQIVDKALDDAGFYTVAVTTKEVEGDNEIFNAIRKAVVEAGIFTAEELEEALEYALIQ